MNIFRVEYVECGNVTYEMWKGGENNTGEKCVQWNGYCGSSEEIEMEMG